MDMYFNGWFEFLIGIVIWWFNIKTPAGLRRCRVSLWEAVCFWNT